MAKLCEYGDQLEKLSAQQVFDIGAGHLLTQNEKSQDEDGHCIYDGGDVCCAAAPFLPKYVRSYEGQSWEQLLRDGLVPFEHADLIEDLQDVHDSYEPGDWVERLWKLAAEKNLSAAVVGELENKGK